MNATQTTNTQTVDDPPFTVQDRRRKGFFTVDNELYDRFGSELGPYGLAVYIGLARFANQESECFPSQSTLAKRAGMSRMQVSREIEKLKELNLIAVEQQFGTNGAQRANLYILLDIPPVTVSDTPCNRQLHPPVTVSDTPCNRQLHRNNTYRNNTQQEQNPHQQTRSRRRQRDPEGSPAVSETNQAVVVALTDVGMSENVAEFLAGKYSEERITEKIVYLEFVQNIQPDSIKSPCGWLRTAIVEDFGRPDGFVAPDEREALEAQHERREDEATEQLRAAQEAQAKRKEEQEARRKALTDQYGTTEEDFAFWDKAKLEITYTTTTPISALVVDMDILKVTEESVKVGIERLDVYRQLKHPGTQIAINRALTSVAGRTVQLVAVEIAGDDRGAAAKDDY